MGGAMRQIERQLQALSRDEQFLLLERLARSLRAQASIPAIASDLEGMAADPAIQRELRSIARDFAATELDGLEDA